MPWTKTLSASDAQRKEAGNQRGSITLVQAGAAIDRTTYFRNELFGNQNWIAGATVTGQPRETANIMFNVSTPGNRPCQMHLEVSHALNRESGQSNYTTLLHLGPLSEIFSAQDMTGRQLTIDQNNNGTFDLLIV
jgi:hypothetical protein